MKPSISVVIPTYKRAFSVLKQAVDSVLCQTLPAKEIIVVSDNPPFSDFAREVKEGLSAYPTVTLLQLPKNSGAPFARNAGIRASVGDWIAFLDDDDLWLPRKLEMQARLFDNARVGLVYCKGRTFYGENTERFEPYANVRWGGFHASASFQELLRHDVIGSTSQAVVRRTCFDECGYFDEALPARQDYDRWLAITQKYLATGVDEALFLHRKHDKQITKDNAVAFRANKLVYKKYRRFYLKDRIARMAYFYTQAYILRARKRASYPLYALRSFLCSPGAFIREYRAYREGA